MREGTRLLMTHRNTALLLERAKVRVEGGRVVYDKAEGMKEKTFNIPFANLAILFLWQGTSLTQSAARVLADEGVFVAFTGTGGSPLHYGALTNYQVTKHMHNMFNVATNNELSLQAAKSAMLKRLELIDTFAPKVYKATAMSADPKDVSHLTNQLRSQLPNAKSHNHLMAAEGILTKELYKLYASKQKIPKFKRAHGEGKRDTEAAIANSRLDQGNYIAYGIAGAALWSLGIPASLSFFHGKTRAGGLVFDLADIFKDAVVLPVAFASHANDSNFRSCLIDLIQDLSLLKICFDFMGSITASASGES
jgi:CRISPR-associated protein Cas1